MHINTTIMLNTWENKTTVKPPTRPTFPHYPALLAAGCGGDIVELCSISIHDQAALWPVTVSQQNAVCQSRTKSVPEWCHITSHTDQAGMGQNWVPIYWMVNDKIGPFWGFNFLSWRFKQGALKTRKISLTSYCTDLSD